MQKNRTRWTLSALLGLALAASAHARAGDLPPAPELDAHVQLTSEDSVAVAGTAPDAVHVEVSGPAQTFAVPVTDGGFQVDVPLAHNRLNRIFFTAVDADGDRSPVEVARVVHDAEPPEVAVDLSPAMIAPGQESVDVFGRISDRLSGRYGLRVRVNGVEAKVHEGFGTNGTFLAQGVPLTPVEPAPAGTTSAGAAAVLQVVAIDRLGNRAEGSISLAGSPQTLPVLIRPSTPVIGALEVVSGVAQTAVVQTELASAIVARVVKPDGSALANKLVNFEVVKSDGVLSEAPGGAGTRVLQLLTDGNGEAAAFWSLGSDAGFGNNLVRVESRDVLGPVFFGASALAGPPDQINVSEGNSQRVQLGGTAPDPLRVWVSDACNGVGGEQVTFTVVQGDGLVNGLTQATVLTEPSGYASVSFDMGTQAGNNLIQADFPGNIGLPATFLLVGVATDALQTTDLRGIALDNSSLPLRNATCTLTIGATTLPSVLTDDEGEFEFVDIGLSGPAHLDVDGATADSVGGASVAPGTYPKLSYELTVVANAANTLSMPALFPELNPANQVVYNGTQNVTLSIAGLEGMTMFLPAGAVVHHPDGTLVDESNPITLSMDQVHIDDIPMPMTDGAAPPFAGTVQPAGATFDPPLRITYPNLSGLKPGTITNFLSFDHDVNQFLIVATGQVAGDGSVIRSLPGDGIDKAGWWCNCPPYSVTSDCCLGPVTCTSTGSLTGGEVEVSFPEGKCLGKPIVFDVKDVDDSGGTGFTTCPDGSTTSVDLNGALSYTWEVTKDGAPFESGTGASAEVTPEEEGAYEATFTATAERECAPPDHDVTSESIDMTRVIDLDIDRNNDGAIDDDDDELEDAEVSEAVGALTELNDNDDNGNDVPDYDDPGPFADPDLEPLEIFVDPTGIQMPVVELDVLSGGDSVNIFRQADKTEQITQFPYVLDEMTEYDTTFYVEGKEWRTEQTRIQLALKDDQTVVCDDTVRLYVGRLAANMPSDVLLPDSPIATVTGLPPGAEFDFEVQRNGGTVSQAQATIGSALAYATTVSTAASQNSPGDTYSVVATADGGNISVSSGACVVFPGLPENVQTGLSNPLVRDGFSTADLTVTLTDLYGNAVENGTGVQIVADLRASEVSQTLLSGETAGGQVQVPLAAPLTDQLDLRVISGSKEHAFTVPVADLTLTAPTPGSSTIAVGDQVTFQITTNAGDGTPVFWTVSNFDPGSLNTATSTVSGGQSTILVDTTGASVGECSVTATVAGALGATQVTYESPGIFANSLQAVMDRPVIVSGYTDDGLYTLTTTADPPSLFAGGSFTRQVDVAVYATSTVTVSGKGATEYDVSLLNPADSAYVTFEGLTGPAGGTLTTSGRVPSETGFGAFGIRSTGAAIAGVHAIDIRIQEVTGTSDGGESVDCRIYYVEPGLWASSLDTVVAFFGGDPKTPSGIAANVAGGILIVGDIGALAKNGWRMVSGGQVNYAEVTLTGAGLLTELAIGAGEVADAPISGVRSLVAFLGKTSFTEVLGILLRRGISNAEDLTQLAAFIARAVSDAPFLTVAKEIFTSQQSMEAGIRVLDDFGDDYANVIASAVTSSTGIGKSAARGTTELLDAPGAVRTAVQSAPAGQVDDAIEGVLQALEKGVDGELLSKALNNEELFTGAGSITTNYTKADYLTDLGVVAKVADETGLTRLVKSTTNAGSGKWGFRYELEAASSIIQETGATNAVFLSRLVNIEDVGKTDIDMVIGATFYQMKRSKSAFKGGAEGIVAWVNKAFAAGAADLVYVTPAIDQIPKAAKNMLDSLIADGVPITLKEVPFK
ncbi:MAG: hypothetical protein AAF682_13160 [Planctomycetota bacterium]